MDWHQFPSDIMKSMAVAKPVSPLLVPLSESSQMELSKFLNHHIEAGLYFRLSGQYQEDIYHEEDNDDDPEEVQRAQNAIRAIFFYSPKATF